MLLTEWVLPRMEGREKFKIYKTSEIATKFTDKVTIFWYLFN